MHFLFAFFLIFNVGNAIFAREFQYLNRSPKGLLMGDAYTAIADDEFTLYYNPAALGRNEGLSFNILNPTIGASNLINDSKRFSHLSNDPVDLTNSLLGIPLYLNLGAAPSIKMANFGLVVIANSTTDMVLRDATHPVLDLDYRYDKGFIVGYAYTIGSGSKQSSGRRQRQNAKRSAGQLTSIGLGVKKIAREGISQRFDLFGLSLLNKIKSSSSTDYQTIKKSLGYSKAQTWGVDSGVEHSLTTGPTQVNFGLSVLDIGNTHFVSDSVNAIPEQKMSVNLGTAFRQDFTIFDYTLSFDLHPLNGNMDFMTKVHLGANFNLPLVGFMVGWNGGYLSYGFSLNLWPISLTAGFYGVELGGHYNQEEAMRAIVYLTLFDFSFGI